MIPGIIAWVRRTARQLAYYLWSARNLYTLSTSSGGGHTSRMSGSYYGNFFPPVRVCYGNEKHVVCSYYSYNVSYTEDLLTWQTNSLPYSLNVSVLMYGAGRFVLFPRQTGRSQAWCLVSEDTKTWTEIQFVNSEEIPTCGIYAGGQFIVLFSNTFQYATSADGINWTWRTMTYSAEWSDITWRNNRYVVSCSNWARVITSNDGVSWTIATVPSFHIALASSPTHYLMLSSVNSVRYSTSGWSWTTVNLPAIDGDLRWKLLEYGGGVFVAVCKLGNVFATSSDMINWTLRTLPRSAEWDQLLYANNKFVLITSYIYTINTLISDDGINWYYSPNYAPDVRDFVFGNGRMIAVSDNRITNVQTETGEWQVHYTKDIVVPSIINKIAYGNSVYVRVSFLDSKTWTTVDGVLWSNEVTHSSNTWRALRFHNGEFFLLAENKILRSPDGVSWTSVTLPESSTWIDIEYGNGKFLCIGANGVAIISSDATSWQQVVLPFDTFSAFSFGNGKFVAFGDTTNPPIYSSDGAIWNISNQLAEAHNWASIAYGDGFYVALSLGFDLSSYKIAFTQDLVTWTIGSSVASGIKIVYENGKFMTLTKQGYIGIIDRSLIQPAPPPIIRRKANFVVNKTDNASINVTTKTVYLEQGQTLKFGTTELDNAYTEYDTYIRLYDPNLVEVDSNDDYNGRGSFISHTALMNGTYTMHIGGYADNYCDGTYAWEVIPAY